MFDLHCHIIPCIDDGAGSLSEAVKMAALAASGSTRGIVCTPHCNIPGSYKNYWAPSLNTVISLLQQELDKNSVPVTLYPGQEVYLGSDPTELIRRGKLITINSSRYMLAEFHPEESFSQVFRLAGILLRLGIVPIIAHPERCGFISEFEDAAEKLKKLGALFQINKDSLFGLFGRDAMQSARALCEKRLADFAASDGHSPYRRTPCLRDAHEAVSELCSLEYADFLFRSNPLRVISDKEIFPYRG